MSSPDFEPRPLYGIGTVARLTGLKPDTLRVWERRYGLGASHKSATGRRQYTQADLDHLQLVAELVRGGARIGEIAGAERRTLEMLLRQHSGAARPPAPSRPSVLFIGVSLGAWLDDHQGLLSNVDARVARCALDEVSGEQLQRYAGCEVIVAETPSLSSAVLERIDALRQATGGVRFIVCYRFGNDHWLRELEQREIVAMDLPPDPGRLAFELARGTALQEVRAGDRNLGELVVARPRRYSATDLAAARSLRSRLDCECPRHIADLIEALANFEEYSASCSVDNWQDAAVHACIYAYTGQARYLMEKAMQSVLEERDEEFRAAVQRGRETKIDHAA